MGIPGLGDQMSVQKIFRDGFREAIANIDRLYTIALADSICEGSLPKERLRDLAAQVYLQEKWPSHIAQVYLQLDEEALAQHDVVNYVISIIKAENLGVGSNGVPHAELARQFAYFTGLSEMDLQGAAPTVENRALMAWCDMSELERPWLEALAVQQACESQVTAMSKIAKGLLSHYGASKNHARLWIVHGGPVERKHKRDGLAILAKYTTFEISENVLYAYDMTSKFNRDFYDSFLRR